MTPEQQLIVKQLAMSSSRPTSHLIEYVDQMIAEAVAAERERCAVLAERMIVMSATATRDPFEAGLICAYRETADAIRAKGREPC